MSFSAAILDMDLLLDNVLVVKEAPLRPSYSGAEKSTTHPDGTGTLERREVEMNIGPQPVSHSALPFIDRVLAWSTWLTK
jgi:hypothetical protein